MAEQSQMTNTNVIGDHGAGLETKSPTVHLSTASPKVGSSISEHSSSVTEPGTDVVKNKNNVISIDDTDSPTVTEANLPALSLNRIEALKKPQLRTGDYPVDVSSRINANQNSMDSELSLHLQNQYKAVARAREPDKKIETTKQSRNAFAWNTNFAPNQCANAQVQKQQQSSNGVNSNDLVGRNVNALHPGQLYPPGFFPILHDMPIGHQQAVALAAAQQHHAAASAAEHHLQWRMNSYQGDTRNDNGSSGISRSDLQRDQLFEKCTADVARRLAGGSKSSKNDRNFSGHEYPQNPGSAVAINERKRSLSESEYSGNHPAARRQHTERRPSNAPTSAQVHRRGHGASMPSQVRDISNTMDIAFDETTEDDTTRTSKASSSGRRVDTPMTYLVRQLLGQVEVFGNEPAVVLAPNLVKEASLKIRAVINKLMEKVADDAKRENQIQIRDFEARSSALEETHAAQNMKNAANLAVLEFFANAQKKKDVDDLKAFADEQVGLVQEQETIIHNLRNQLRAAQSSLTVLREDLAAVKRQQRAPSEKHSNATIRNLITQLDDGMTKLQHQKKEIDVLKAVIRKDAESLKGCHDMREFLINTFGLCDPKTNPPLLLAAAGRDSADVTESNQNESVNSLRNEVEELKAALKLEHERGESALRAYMRAAVHALKMQKESLEE